MNQNTILLQQIFSEKLIMIVTILFVLSMIAERIATFLKLHLPEEGIRFFKSQFHLLNPRNYKIKQNNKEQEKIREKNILVLALISGFITSVAIKANLIEILQSNDCTSCLGWQNSSLNLHRNLSSEVLGTQIWDLIKILTGCMLTAFFISVGSKFWHDLLDLLLNAKNLKDKLGQKETYEFDKVEQLDEWLKLTETDIVRLAISQNEEILKIKFSNIRCLNETFKIINGERKNVVGIYLTDNNALDIPSVVEAKLKTGKNYNVSTEIITGLGIAKISSMEGSVASEDSLEYKGSACCVLVDSLSNKYLLTNCHVLTEGKKENPMYNTNECKCLYDDKKVGSWKYGSITPDGDFALIEIESDDFLSEIKPEIFKNQIYEITKDDWLKTEVNIRGNKSGIGKAFIIGVFTDVSVEYKYGEIQKFKEVIKLANSNDQQNCSPVTTFGDSGGVAYDKNNRLIGIITANDSRFTYIIPIKNFIKNQKLTIY